MNTKVTDISGPDALLREYDLVGERKQEPHYYEIQTELATHSSKGKVKSVDTYREFLRVEPGNRSAGEPDRFICGRFYVQRGDGPEVTIPSLEGFSYEVNKEVLDKNDLDEHGQLYAIPEEKFEGLTEHTGEKLPFEVGYQVYSAFFYYHSYVDYAEPTSEGKGVQSLKRIGDKIVHNGSFVESPLPGKLARESSIWKYGEITLEFKGLGVVDGQPCAILGFDSGVCTWSMPMTYMPIMNLKTTGVSNYHGDIYLDLNSYWVRKVEMVLSEITNTTMWGIPVDKSIPRTRLTIRAIGKDEFDKD
jgi:hypothetical protein